MLHSTGIVILAALGCCLLQDVSHAADNQRAPPVTSKIAAPTGTENLAVEWASVTIPELGVLRLAIARPSGAGPFPTVLVLHGTHGFAREYVQFAEALAREGRLAVAACWFNGGSGHGTRFVTPIACPEAPAMSMASSDLASTTLDALVRAVRALPDAKPEPVALFGHSRGGGAALNYVLKGGEARALALECAGYPAEVTARAALVDVPVLILHGALNGTEDGGSPVTTVEMAQAFESAMRSAGKRVTAMYYKGSGHSGMFTNPEQFNDEARRVAAFVVQ